MLSSFSVTASSSEETEALRSFFTQYDPRLIELYHCYPTVFAPPNSIPPVHSVVHRICLKSDVMPIRRLPYLLGAEKTAAMQEQITDLADKS